MHDFIFRRILVVGITLLTGAVQSAPVSIASLNPIVSDLARQVGGDLVDVIDLMPLNANPHAFYPGPTHLKQASQSRLILAAGKGLETYLDSFKESLGGQISILEVGRGVPSLRVDADDVFLCCPVHARGAIDPHWWHSVRNARRGARALADAFIEVDPDNRHAYNRHYADYAARLDALHEEVRREIGSIPRRYRHLTTSHAAFGYLCREYGLQSITVLGLTTEQNPDPGYLKEVIQTLRRHRVRAVFPEKNANPKVLESIARETGVRVAGGLYADTLPLANPTYEAMMRHNVSTIVKALRPE